MSKKVIVCCGGMPIQYQLIVDGELTNDPEDLVRAQIDEVLKIYEAATIV